MKTWFSKVLTVILAEAEFPFIPAGSPDVCLSFGTGETEDVADHVHGSEQLQGGGDEGSGADQLHKEG